MNESLTKNEHIRVPRVISQHAFLKPARNTKIIQRFPWFVMPFVDENGSKRNKFSYNNASKILQNRHFLHEY